MVVVSVVIIVAAAAAVIAVVAEVVGARENRALATTDAKKSTGNGPGGCECGSSGR